jgi:hypothetical protein
VTNAPNIPFDSSLDHYEIAIEYVEGEPPSEKINKQTLTVAEIVRGGIDASPARSMKLTPRGSTYRDMLISNFQ